MRYIDAGLKARIEQAQQTIYANADPCMIVWASRHTTPLTGPLYLEKATIESTAGITSVSVAARRPMLDRQADRMYAAVCSGGAARVLRSSVLPDISAQTWASVDTVSDAVKAAIAFDGRMVKSVRGNTEFVTVGEPWLFWIDAAGALRGKPPGGDPVVLAESQATAVAAVRGHQSEAGGFDQGLVVFFLLAGVLYYRAYVDGAWTDGQPAEFGPSGTWTDLAAGRTWDYRLAVQLVDASGRVVELFTQSEGIAKQNVEHLEISKLEAAAARVPVTYHDTEDAEHIELADIAATGALPWGATGNSITRAANVDNGSGDWGRIVEVEVQHPLYSIGTVLLEDVSAAQVIPQESATLIGGVLTIEASSALEFGFNAVTGDIRVTITGALNEAGIAYDQMVEEFTPTNLVPPAIDPPEVEAIYNE